MNTLSGIIERITFHNAENGFAVLRVHVKGERDLVTVVGQVPRVVAGEYLEAAGTWREDPEHGRQFQAQTIKTAPPNSIEGIEKFLGSGLIKGIGPVYARKIVEVFGERTLQIIDESPTFLSEVKGIGRQRIQQIRESWKQQKAVRDIMVFLHSHGLGTARAVRIWKAYGDLALEKVRENPYRLASEIWGIGFQTADQLAQSMGVDRQSPLRARAALRYALQELTQQGHCAFPRGGVLERTANLTEIDVDLLAKIAAELVQEGALKCEVVKSSFHEDAEDAPDPSEPWLYLPQLYQAEVDVAQSLMRLCQGFHPMPEINLDAALGWVEKKMNLTLAPTQRDAIRQATTSKVLVITGGPGVGKTTIIRGILEIFQAKKLRCLLCAPTGRAAKRLAETTGQQASTIHRLLEFQAGRGKATYHSENPLDADLLIVDEMSMVDLPLMHHLVRAVPDRACLVLVGDIDQLPSVGPGMVLKDIIASGAVPVVRLTEIFRQAQQSGIVQAAYHVLRGEMPESATQDQPGDFYIVEAETPADILKKIVTMVWERIPARFGLDPIRDVQVLTPMNRSELGTRNLNQQLQGIFNPHTPPDYAAGGSHGGGSFAEVERFGWTFRAGDKVLQTVNSYEKEVFNGDVGRVRRINMDDEEMIVDFDGRQVHYAFDDLDELNLAYAMTIHKSQGSEYPAVVLPLHSQHYMMLQRNLLYTGITRGKKLVVLVGQRKALSLAVRRQDTSKRCTALAGRLAARTTS
jgi:exodeoxyribonuclease V alpha subunit